MIQKLTIKNVALIENAEIEFCNGLNVLSGETGAGKSVILDSVNFVLGAKADKSMIRYGQQECFVRAEFIVNENSQALKELKELDIDSDSEIIISRKYTMEGKSLIKINGETVTAAMLRKVTTYLVDVHGQSEHFFLLNTANQLKVLDSICGNSLILEKDKLKNNLEKIKAIKTQLSTIGTDEEERARKIDVLKFQIDEITSADLKDEEEEQLQQKKNKINHLEKIILAIQEASSALSNEGAATDCIQTAKKDMISIAKIDEEYNDIAQRLENLYAEADDISSTIEEFSNNLSFDEGEAEEIENRLELYKNLKRKYGGTVQEVLNFLDKSEKEYDLLSNCDEQFQKLTSALSIIKKETFTICQNITSIRKNTSLDFCKSVTEELKTLNIPHAQFDVFFNEYRIENVEKATNNGMDCIEFLFSANMGEPVKSMSKIISGGEMSRLMLALKTQLSDINEISTYIFDEIDAGISGKTAKVVAEKFAKISKKTQIIAVSHLAQIAVMADKEYLIEKSEEKEKTITNVFCLDDIGRKKEIIRLLGGEEQSQFASNHAQELLDSANFYKKSLS